MTYLVGMKTRGTTAICADCHLTNLDRPELNANSVVKVGVLYPGAEGAPQAKSFSALHRGTARRSVSRPLIESPPAKA
jgi:hypothetical protein